MKQMKNNSNLKNAWLCMMAKLPTPCMASQLNPLSHQLKAKAGALLPYPFICSL